jgi:hypothetical protein
MEVRMVVVKLDANCFGEKNGSDRHQNLNQSPPQRQMKQPLRNLCPRHTRPTTAANLSTDARPLIFDEPLARYLSTIRVSMFAI